MSSASGDKASDPLTYFNIIQVLVPLYFVVLLGWIAGRTKSADEFMLDRLNAFNAKFALPGLLFRNIASSNLYDADFSIVAADILYKVIIGFVLAIWAKLASAKGEAAENWIVAHSVMSLPNYVVIGIPVLSALYTPATAKLFMGLLLMEQVSIHLTFVAGFIELCCRKAKPAVVGEHAHGALSKYGPPRHTDHEGFGIRLKQAITHHELRSFLHHPIDYHHADDDSAAIEHERAHAAEHEHAHAHGEEGHDNGEEGETRYLAGGGDAAPEESGLKQLLRIMKDRLLLNPMVLGAVSGVLVSMAVKATDHKRKLPYILDATSLYLNNCVLGVSLFNFGLFSYLNGVVSCTPKEAVAVVVGRFLISPAINLPIMYAFGMKGETLKIMVMQAALPQAVSSFVVFKEFKVRPEVFSTSMVLGTAMCLPATCIWFFILDKTVASI